MTRRTSILLLALVLSGVAFFVWTRFLPDDAPPPGAFVVSHDDTSKPAPIASPQLPLPGPPACPAPFSPPLFTDVMARMVAKGWTEEAATAVVRFHSDWLTELRRNDMKGFDRTVLLLEQLVMADDLSGVLARRPELAGLFLMAGEHAPNLTSELDRGDDKDDILTSLFLAYLAPEDVRRFAAAIPDNREQIAALIQRGIVGGEVLFIFDRDTEGGRAYDTWLRDEVRRALLRSDDQLVDTFVFLLAEGPGIREQLASDGYRRAFPAMWEALRRAAISHEGAITELVGLRGIWEFLERKDAGELLAKRGALAVELVGPKSRYPAGDRDRVASMLLQGDENVVWLLHDCRDEVAFLPFLQKKVPLDLIRGIAVHLGKRQPDRTKQLKLLQQKLNAGEVDLRSFLAGPAPAGPIEYLPGYSLYRLYEKDPDDIGALDVAFATADLATVAFPVGKFGLSLGKSGLKRLTKQAAKDLVTTEAKDLVKSRTGKLAGEVTASKATAWVVAGNMARKAAEVVRSVMTKGVNIKLPTVDVTGAIRFAFKHTGLGRETLRRLTGLEARLFMRSDARLTLKTQLVLKPGKVIVHAGKHWVKHFLDERFGTWKDEEGKAVAQNARAASEGKLIAPGREEWARAAGALWLAAAAGLLPEENEVPINP